MRRVPIIGAVGFDLEPGAGWIYGPDYLPTGEPLYGVGSAANAGSYVDPTGKMVGLITATITGPLSQENSALTTYANYVAQQDPVIFGPTSLGTYGGYASTVVDKKLGGYADLYIETIFGIGYRFQPFGAARFFQPTINKPRMALGA